jgi:hypothetical protein
MEETRKGGEDAAGRAEAKGMDEDFEDLLMHATEIFAAWRSKIGASNDEFRDE